MDPAEAVLILQALAEGADPFTGEVIEEPPGLLDPRTRAALELAIAALQPGRRPRRTQRDRQGAPWTAQEDENLAAAFDKQEPVAEIARRHQRRSTAIRARLVRVGLVENPGEKGDADFVRAFEAGVILARSWTHRGHLRVAWAFLREEPVGPVVERLRRGLRALLERYGIEETPSRGYHETLTVAWVRVLAARMEQGGAQGCFQDFIALHPDLLDKRYLRRHYSVERMMSAEARLRFVAPDKEPLPRAAPLAGDSPPGGTQEEYT